MENTMGIIMLIAGAVLFVFGTFFLKDKKRNRINEY